MRKMTGVLVISHGSRDPDWVQLVDEAVSQLAYRLEWPVVGCFLEIVEGRLIQDGINHLEKEGATDIVVVPLFISSGSTHIDEIHYALGVTPRPQIPTDLKPFRKQSRIAVCTPLDADPVVAAMLLDQLKPLIQVPQREQVLLIGHGSRAPGFYEQWQSGMNGVAEQLQALGDFRRVRTALLLPDEITGSMEEWQMLSAEADWIAAPLFLSEGYFTRKVIPDRLQSLAHRYNGKALLPHPRIVEWLERTVRKRIASIEDPGI